MNKLTIIGNLTRNPELRTTTNGVNVCSFTVAVNRRARNDEPQQADYFDVSAWRERGELCAKYLEKGKKVCVVGAVEVTTYTANDGTTRAKMKVTADEVEFLSPRTEQAPAPAKPENDPQNGYEVVEMDELPF